MLPRAKRLRIEREIEPVLKSKKGVFDLACGIKFSPNLLGYPRVTVIAGKKVSKSAVVRNLQKRQFRGAIEELYNRLTAVDLILLLGKSAVGMDYPTKVSLLTKNLTKAGVLTKTPTNTGVPMTVKTK